MSSSVPRPSANLADVSDPVAPVAPEREADTTVRDQLLSEDDLRARPFARHRILSRRGPRPGGDRLSEQRRVGRPEQAVLETAGAIRADACEGGLRPAEDAARLPLVGVAGIAQERDLGEVR